MKKRIKLQKIVMLVMSVIIVVLAGYIVLEKDVSEYDEVNAYVNSDASNASKIMYLEKRYENEKGRLDILLNHSDICSPKYLNELSSLSLSMEATLKGYDELGKQVELSKYENLTKKWNDYKNLEENYNEMYKQIEKEEYEEALVSLGEVEKVLAVVYQNIDKEVAEVE